MNTPTEYGGVGLGADAPGGGDGQVDAAVVEHGLQAHLAHEPVLGLQMKHGPVEGRESSASPQNRSTEKLGNSAKGKSGAWAAARIMRKAPDDALFDAR